MPDAEKRVFASLNIPVIAELYGPIYMGSIVLVEMSLEAAPNLMLATIVSKSLEKKHSVSVILYRDYVQDYYTLLESLGVPARNLMHQNKLIIMESGNLEKLVSNVSEALLLSDVVAVYAISLDDIGWDDAVRMASAAKKSSSILYIIIDPDVMKHTYILERISDVVLRALVEETDKGYSRKLILVYSKRRARRDISAHYTVSEKGLSFESLTRM